jgi:hypothetical protein
LLAVGACEQGLKPSLHLVHLTSEISQLACDRRDVLFGRHGAGDSRLNLRSEEAVLPAGYGSRLLCRVRRQLPRLEGRTYSRRVRFYGLTDYSVQELVELFPTREQAEETLREVLADEPEWVAILGIETLEFDTNPN